ncbi:MAG: hypothetical protein AB4372_10780 [Xenococcus sp. (in: cyanobacteria)]
MAKYFSFAFSASMILEDCSINVSFVDVSDKAIFDEIMVSQIAVNPSYKATIEAIYERYGLQIEIPAFPPKIDLKKGDSLIVCQVVGLPRLTDRKHYSKEEIDSANFEFIKFEVH